MKFEESEINGVRYPVSEISIRKDARYGNPIITGKVTNNTDESNPYFYINVIFHDKNGAVIGMTGDDSKKGSGLDLEDMAPGETRPFTLDRPWKKITGNFTYGDIDINNLEVIASRHYSQR